MLRQDGFDVESKPNWNRTEKATWRDRDGIMRFADLDEARQKSKHIRSAIEPMMTMTMTTTTMVQTKCVCECG